MPQDSIWDSIASSPATGSCIGNKGEGYGRLDEPQHRLAKRLCPPFSLRVPSSCIPAAFLEPRRSRPTLNLWSVGMGLVGRDPAPAVVLVSAWALALELALLLEKRSERW